MCGTYLPAGLQRAVGVGEVLVAGVRRGQPTTPDGGAQLVQPLQLLDEVRVELSRPQRQPADRTAGRVQLELLLAWGTQEIVETEGRVAHTSLVYCITHQPTASTVALPLPATIH